MGETGTSTALVRMKFGGNRRGVHLVLGAWTLCKMYLKYQPEPQVVEAEADCGRCLRELKVGAGPWLRHRPHPQPSPEWGVTVQSPQDAVAWLQERADDWASDGDYAAHEEDRSVARELAHKLRQMRRVHARPRPR